MLPVESNFRWCTLAWLLFTCACSGQLTSEAPDVDLDRWDLGQKEDLLGRLLDDLPEQNGSSIYNLSILNRYGRTIDRTLGGLQGTRVLEIGPGRNLAVGVAMVLKGARRYSAVDIYQHPELYEPDVYLNMHRLARRTGWRDYNIGRFDEVVRIEDGSVHLDPDRIEWLYPHESYAFPMADDAVDFAFSHSGFEHFNEPRKTIGRLFQVLRPGGVTAHSIDLRDHDDFSRPYEFLKLSAEEWRSRFTEENLHNFTNRWRAVDFQRAFEDAGFEILEDKRREQAEVTEELQRALHSDFQGYSLEELSATNLWIVARKPGPEAPEDPAEPAASK